MQWGRCGGVERGVCVWSGQVKRRHRSCIYPSQSPSPPITRLEHGHDVPDQVAPLLDRLEAVQAHHALMLECESEHAGGRGRGERGVSLLLTPRLLTTLQSHSHPYSHHHSHPPHPHPTPTSHPVPLALTSSASTPSRPPTASTHPRPPPPSPAGTAATAATPPCRPRRASPRGGGGRRNTRGEGGRPCRGHRPPRPGPGGKDKDKGRRLNEYKCAYMMDDVA